MSGTPGAAAGSSSGLSTLSTALLAAACTAVAASAIFVAVALRRYLQAKKRKSFLIAPSQAPASAAAIYAQRIKDKSISAEDISVPNRTFASERAYNVQHGPAKSPLAQRSETTMRQHNLFSARPFASPKLPKAALLSPRMPPPVSADQSSPQTPRTPKSPGLTELALSPGPSILLKPVAYGKSPRITSPSPSKASATDKKIDASEQKRKLTRSAVPSMLLRSLGVLPDFSATSSSEAKETLVDIEMQAKQDPNDEEEPSLTPILDLGIDFGNEESFEQSLQLPADFSFDRNNSNTLGLDSLASEQAKQPQMSVGMQSLIDALSPTQPETEMLPRFRANPPAKLTAVHSFAPGRSHLPTPPPSAGLPPAPTSAPMHKLPSNGSLQSKSSKATATSAASSALDSFHSATGSTGQICINMDTIDTALSPNLDSEDGQETLLPYRPLSLGLGPAKSASHDTLTNLLNGLHTPSRSSDDDLEASNPSIDESSTNSRSSSSDDMSLSSSQTSVDEANTSIGKANIVPAASIPPLPPTPVSVPKTAQDQTHQASFPATFADEPSEAVAPFPTRKRASTLGALDRPKVNTFNCMNPRTAPMPPSDGNVTSPSINVESFEVNHASIMNRTVRSSDHLPLAGTSKGAGMNFKSPYHHTLIPDPPMDAGHLSPGLGADSPILAQLSPKIRGTSPSLSPNFSPKPGFTESLKARLSLSRKSMTSSPGLASKNSTPLSTLHHFPKPNGDRFHNFADSADVGDRVAGDATPKVKSSQPAETPARPSTSPLLGQQANEVRFGFSPAILFNGQKIEPTEPLRFKKPSSAAGRLEGSPQSLYSAASPSPMLHTSQWGVNPTVDAREDAVDPSEAVSSPRVAQETPSGEQIEFGVTSSPSICGPAAAPALNLNQPQVTSASTSPVMGDTTPRPDLSSDSSALALQEEELESELEHLSYRDSMISVAASTISIMSNSTCLSDTMGEDLDLAADRRAKLLASVQQNVAKAKAKDAKRDSQAAQRYRKSQMSQTSSLRNIPEEVSGGVQTMGLGLFESEEERDDEERETLEDSPKSAVAEPYACKKLNDLVLMPHTDSRLVGPLTPPLTPVDATATQKQSRHAPTPSTSSACSASSAGSVPRRVRPSRGQLAPIDTNAANRLSPYGEQRDGASSPSSLKLRPLSLAASLHGGDSSPMKRFERPAFSPALPANFSSPVPAHVSGDRSSRYNEECRSSRCTTYRQGGVLPTVSSKGALETGRAGHAEPSLTHSDSNTSMGSIASSLGSFSRIGHFPSPVKSSFGHHGLGKAMGMRHTLGSRGSVISDVQDLPTTGMIGRLAYKTSDLSVDSM